MIKTITIFLILIFGLTLFAFSRSFVTPTTPSLYISLSGCVLCGLLLLIIRMKKPTIHVAQSEGLITIWLLYVGIVGVYYGTITPENIIVGISLLLFYGVVRRVRWDMIWLLVGFSMTGFVQAVYGLGQYLHWFVNWNSNFPVCGTFDNPVGFAAALSVCFPFALLLVSKKEICWKIVGSLVAVVLIVAIVLSQSRAGVIAIIIISGVWALKSFNLNWLNRWRSRTKILCSAVFIFALLTGLYFIKKNSADGRLLIWQCSVRMIADRPLLGHGTGGFLREYMLYQADFFRNHPNSSYSMLSDIVKQPFNEFLLLLVEHGLVGGLFFGLFLYALYQEYRKNISNDMFYVMLCLVSIGVFACFSYPLSYPFVRLMMIFCAAFIMQNEARWWNMPHGLFSVLKPTVMVGSVTLLVLTCTIFYDEYRWNVIAQRSLAGETKAVMPDYAKLYKTMNRNGLFLYNYAAELNFIDHNAESNRLFIESSHFMNDIDLQLQMADNYQKMKQYKEAEKCLMLASEMIPNRFIPLYRLAKLYEDTNRLPEAIKIAKQLISKPIKIMSSDIMTIRVEMQELINKEGIKQL